MYGKVFESMYSGSLYGQWEAIVTMQQLIVLADADGVIDMTPPAITGKTSIPLEIIEKGIKILSAPDPYTRTPGSDGVRIQLLDPQRSWGWFLVNHEKYKMLRTSSDRREYMREYMAKRRSEDVNHDVNTCKHLLTQLANKEEETDKDKDIKSLGRQATASDGFDQFWDVYPKKRKKKMSLDIWKRNKLAGKAAQIYADVLNRKQQDRRWLEGYVPDPPTYLNGERWADEIEGARQSIDPYMAEMERIKANANDA